MKRIALAAVYEKINYGTVLQCFALQKVLESQKIDAKVIHRCGIQKLINKNRRNYYRHHALDLSLYKAKMGLVFHILRQRTDKKFQAEMNQRKKAFADFIHGHISFTEPMEDARMLEQHCRDCDAVIVGSDQLWLPVNLFGDFYTLSFVPDGVKRLSYATSFGVADMNSRERLIAQNFLKKMDKITVREMSGQKLVHELTDKTVELVCDPTILFTAQQWDQYLKPAQLQNVPENYIFCYFLGKNMESREYARKLSRETGLPIVVLRHLDEYIAQDEQFGDVAPYDAGPAEFVSLIRNAAYVCTDSFHGTVFSILYNKVFYTFFRHAQKNRFSTNSRIESLLSVAGLEHRLISNVDTAPDFGDPIDFDAVNQRMAAFREESKKILFDMVNNDDSDNR